ncbi:50S ribosomal protein L25/general stress protein Ctc [Subtercola boreus]|uniref:Large ribosomal subunit protein bL25 n=1 Tax=Subtercola boreus TaxID=120213 RepID=A0A3E0WBF7_9MICO|nr:50S ribosomal protein L25/general stress protein Ctc [Subtercola boreus]RFA19853.1 50S ribosomal protein L25/general stress protein Ctc [Subtercola boreus]RFA19920.1 50S ribosomal protein L25/general stress protein Ctc [Subtercola boreus]RFA26313.1 50S ribosomal protein L25/general stress protein Ctc [Subtercola boreus]
MADDNKIAAETRTSFGKGAARKLRAAGRIPAVIYGHGGAPQHVSLPGHEVFLLIRKSNALIELDIDGATQLALVKDVQKDPVRQIIEHLDLITVRQGERVEVEVSVLVEGEPASGTVAELDTFTLLLEVLATNIPSRVTVNVEGAEDGTQILAKDIELPEGAVLVGDEDQLIVAVSIPEEQDLGDSLSAGDASTTDAPAAE